MELTYKNAILKARMKWLEFERIVVAQFVFHRITEISEQLTVNQFVIDIKKWTMKKRFVRKVHLMSHIIQTHITVTYHCKTQGT